MIDGIILADGTSRLARSVADFKTRYPTYDDFAAALVAGTLPLDVLFHEGGWIQQPTFLNKANLMDDFTAALFGLDNTAVPNDVLNQLGRYNLHWWRKSRYTQPTFKLGEETEVGIYYGNTIYYSEGVNISKGGFVSLAEPVMTYEGASLAGTMTAFMNSIKGMYFNWSGHTEEICYRTQTDATTKSNATYFHYQSVTGVAGDVGASLGYEASEDETAWPQEGNVGQVWYEYLGKPFQNAVNASKFVWGSYQGTGTYGVDNPNELTFEAPPKIVALTVSRSVLDRENSIYPNGYSYTNHSYWLVDMRALTTEYGYSQGFGDTGSDTSLYAKKSEDGKSLLWYNSAYATYQCNSAVSEYFYFAVM